MMPRLNNSRAILRIWLRTAKDPALRDALRVWSEGDLVAYPARHYWSRRFKPHLRAVRPTVQSAIETIRPKFDASRQIPREAGWCIDVAWPLSRTGARAYQCHGYCHQVAAYMFDLARRAFPRRTWWILNAERHTVVIASDGTVIDLMAERGSIIGERSKLQRAPDLANFRDNVLKEPFAIWNDLDAYVQHLRESFAPDEPGR